MQKKDQEEHVYNSPNNGPYYTTTNTRGTGGGRIAPEIVHVDGIEVPEVKNTNGTENSNFIFCVKWLRELDVKIEELQKGVQESRSLQDQVKQLALEASEQKEKLEAGDAEYSSAKKNLLSKIESNTARIKNLESHLDILSRQVSQTLNDIGSVQSEDCSITDEVAKQGTRLNILSGQVSQGLNDIQTLHSNERTITEKASAPDSEITGCSSNQMFAGMVESSMQEQRKDFEEKLEKMQNDMVDERNKIMRATTLLAVALIIFHFVF